MEDILEKNEWLRKRFFVYCNINGLCYSVSSFSKFMDEESEAEEKEMEDSFAFIDEIRGDRKEQIGQISIDKEYYIDWITKLLLSGINMKDILEGTTKDPERMTLIVNKDFSLEIFDANLNSVVLELPNDERSFYILCVLLSKKGKRLTLESGSKHIDILKSLFEKIERIYGWRSSFDTCFKRLIPEMGSIKKLKKVDDVVINKEIFVDYRDNVRDLCKRINKKLIKISSSCSCFRIDSDDYMKGIIGIGNIFVSPQLDFTLEDYEEISNKV